MSSQAARSTGAREPGDGARMGAGLAAPRAAAAMAAAARGLLGAVTGEQAYVLNPGFDDFDLGSPRRQWTYLPELERPGLPLRAMSDPQRKLAHELITASVSMEGYAKVVSVMAMEHVRRALMLAPRRSGHTCSTRSGTASASSATQARPASRGAGSSPGTTSCCYQFFRKTGGTLPPNSGPKYPQSFSLPQRLTISRKSRSAGPV